MQKHHLDKIGPGVWYTLHLFSAHAENTKDIEAVHALIGLIRKNFFCTHCRDHFDSNTEKYPPPHVNENNELFGWTVMMHNKVNILNDKPVITVEEALRHYKGDSQFCTSGCGNKSAVEEKFFVNSDSKIEELIHDSLSSNPKYYPKLKLGSIWE